MTAAELFYKLGYEQTRKTENVIYYLKHHYVDGFGFDNTIIKFEYYSVECYLFNDDSEYYTESGPIDMDELIAINKQVEELGWNRKEIKD